MDGVAPQVVFQFLGISITDTIVSTWIMMIVIIGGVIVIRRFFPSLLERLIAFLSDTISDVMERPAEPYLPYLGALIVFILVANVIGVVPIVTTPTKDLNTTAALAITVFLAVHIFGIRKKGVWEHIKGMAAPLGLFFLMLPLDIIGQLSRTLALALRLFGNIVSSELIVEVVYEIAPIVVPLPMIALGLFTGVLQAYIFTILAAVFINLAVRENK
jgi:F-type H+-transporting ATPase subunit a